MEIRIRYLGMCQILAGNRKEETIDISPGTTISELLRRLSEKYGERFRHYMIEEPWGQIRNDVRISVDGEPLRQLPKKDQTKLEGKREVLLTTTLFARGG